MNLKEVTVKAVFAHGKLPFPIHILLVYKNNLKKSSSIAVNYPIDRTVLCFQSRTENNELNKAPQSKISQKIF